MHCFDGCTVPQAPRKARVSYPKSLKEPSLSEDEDKESQGSSDVDAASAEEDDDADEDFEA